jgi:O-Antigen ligase
MRSLAALPVWLGRIDWGAVGVWLLGFGLIAYLGLDGGGYDALVHDQVGIAVWWVLLAGVLVGALPRRRIEATALTALGLLTAFVVWTALSMGWTESVGRTFADLARVSGYLGVFALALAVRGSDNGRRVLAAVAAGIAFVAIVGLLSRLHPAWFPAGAQTAQFLSGNEERLSYPIHYWNGLAALLAIGLPLLLQFAAGAQSIAVRALAAAALPIIGLTAFLTLSRGGIGAAVIALAVFLAFAADRLPKLLSLAVAATATVVLCVALSARDSLHDGLLNTTSEAQGDEMLVLTVIVCLAAAAAQVGISLSERRRPRWTFVPRRNAQVAIGAVGVVALLGFLAFGGFGRGADAWDEFKRADSPGEGSGRLVSAAGQNRYAYWSSAVDQSSTKPLTGTGSGTFEYWWARDRDTTDAVRDTHSLYLQTLGELGIVGLALLGAFLLTILIGGARATVRASPAERSLLAAALAGCVAFCLTAAVDWMWQIPVIVVAMLLLAAVLMAPGPLRDDAKAAFRLPLRLGVCLAAIVAIVVVAIPLTSETHLRESEEDVRNGDLYGALAAAKSAQNAEPGAAAPRLQQALVLEQIGALDQAAVVARTATEREETNWRNWLVLSRIEAQRGRAGTAVSAYRRARSLNPESPLFDD